MVRTGKGKVVNFLVWGLPFGPYFPYFMLGEYEERGPTIKYGKYGKGRKEESG